MNEKRGKILGTFLFVVLLLLLIYLIFFVSKRYQEGKIEMIEITGNTLLREADYLNFTMLKNAEEVTLPVIKDRLEKHPYVKSAEVELEGSGKARVFLTEKKIMAVILIEPDPYFLTEDFQILPMFMNTKFVDVPVISNTGNGKNWRSLQYVRSEDLEQAFRIIDAAKLAGRRLSESLSEINLRSGGDIILTFSGLRAPVLFGKDGAAKKMVYLDMVWDKIVEGKSLLQNSEYVDLRFANEIFIGNSEKTGLLK